jgi:hypothetical protein
MIPTMKFGGVKSNKKKKNENFPHCKSLEKNKIIITITKKKSMT